MEKGLIGIQMSTIKKKVDELEALLDSGHARRAFAVTPMDW